MNTKTKRGLIIAGISVLIAVSLVILILLSYVAYLAVGYYRIADNLSVNVENNKTAEVSIGEEYTISTYNIGFGAYTQDFDFFMDSGVMKDGTEVTGSRARANSEESVENAVNGAIDEILNLNTDFAFFQEVDQSADRSYKVNQYEMIKNAFTDFSSSYSSNMHTSFLYYPLNDPIGQTESGIVTLSKYDITSAMRRSFPIDESFINKFFDLDRCFQINRLSIANSDKELVLINLHLSAYDEGGKIREKQLEMLFEIIGEEYAKGNYVICGGDWNHDIADSLTYFESEQKVPLWVQKITDGEVPEGFSFAKTLNAPTCRAAEMAYEKGVNYTVVIDGFLISDNIELVSVENIDTDFEFSDHNPVCMKFVLNDITE